MTSQFLAMDQIFQSRQGDRITLCHLERRGLTFASCLTLAEPSKFLSTEWLGDGTLEPLKMELKSTSVELDFQDQLKNWLETQILKILSLLWLKLKEMFAIPERPP